MVDEQRFSSRPSQLDEESVSDRLHNYLDEQGVLDRSDLNLLDQFIRRHDGPLTYDWDRIVDALEHQGELKRREQLLALALSPEDIATARGTEIFQSIGSSAHWAVLLGAGASRPAPTNIPLVSELLEILWRKAEEVNARSLLRIREQAESANLGITNIEDLLTAIDVAQTVASSPRVRGLVRQLLFPEDNGLPRARLGSRAAAAPPSIDDLRESSQTLFSLLVGMMRTSPANAIHKAIADRAGEGGLTVLSTNYDVCMERALEDSGYYYEGVEPGKATSGTPVLKMHGSLNWFACRNCDRVVTAKLSDIAHAIDAGIYPVVSQCPSCEALAPHLIVPPIGSKLTQHPALLDIRQAAEDTIKDAALLAVVGYSFQETDEYILRMMSRAVAGRETDIVVFDTSEEPAGRLNSFLRAHATDFDVEAHVHAVRGDAATTFPAFVSVWRAYHVASLAAAPPSTPQELPEVETAGAVDSATESG